MLQQGFKSPVKRALRAQACAKAMLAKWIKRDNPAIQDVPEAIIDYDTLNETKNLFGEQFAKTIESYLSDATSRIATMERLIVSEKKSGEVVIEAHSLKSASGYIGARQMVTLARTMEHAARDAAEAGGEVKNLRSLLGELRQAFSTLRPILEKEAALR